MKVNDKKRRVWVLSGWRGMSSLAATPPIRPITKLRSLCSWAPSEGRCARSGSWAMLSAQRAYDSPPAASTSTCSLAPSHAASTRRRATTPRRRPPRQQRRRSPLAGNPPGIHPTAGLSLTSPTQIRKAGLLFSSVLRPGHRLPDSHMMRSCPLHGHLRANAIRSRLLALPAAACSRRTFPCTSSRRCCAQLPSHTSASGQRMRGKNVHTSGVSRNPVPPHSVPPQPIAVHGHLRGHPRRKATCFSRPALPGLL